MSIRVGLLLLCGSVPTPILTKANVIGIESYFGNRERRRAEGTMPGDPKECRQHALNCMFLAKQTANQESKQTFLSLSQSRTRLAVSVVRVFGTASWFI
jgi:hypothetical protein